MRTKLALAALIFALGAAAPAAAQDDEVARLRMQLRTVTLQLRQAQDDQAAMQAQKIAVEAERDKAKKELAAVQGQLSHARRDTSRSDALAGELSKTRDALAKAGAATAEEKAERAKVEAASNDQTAALGQCQEANAKLLVVAREILKDYDSRGFFDAVGAREPVTKLKRVELENMAQDYRDRIDQGVYAPKPERKTDKTDKPDAVSKPDGN